MRHIPNFITLMNLLAGLLAIYFALHGMLYYASFLILAGAVFDFFDGFAARLLKVSSPVGAELDSLSDLVTFGAAPAFMLLYILQKHYGSVAEDSIATIWPIFIPFVLVLFSALRLAKFNVDDAQTFDFKGLPTPANALFQVSFALLLVENPNFVLGVVVYPIIVVMALLLVLPIQLIGFKKFHGDRKKYIIILIGISVFLLILFQHKAGVLIIPFYILISAVKSLIKKPAR